MERSHRTKLYDIAKIAKICIRTILQMWYMDTSRSNLWNNTNTQPANGWGYVAEGWRRISHWIWSWCVGQHAPYVAAMFGSWNPIALAQALSFFRRTNTTRCITKVILDPKKIENGPPSAVSNVFWCLQLVRNCIWADLSTSTWGVNLAQVKNRAKMGAPPVLDPFWGHFVPNGHIGQNRDFSKSYSDSLR